MIYAQFYQKSAIRNALVEACGDRGVFILDGRNSLTTQKADAREQAEKRGYLAFRIMKGETFTRAQPVTGIIVLDPTHWSNEGLPVNAAEFVTQTQLDAMPTCDVGEMMKVMQRTQVTMPGCAPVVVDAPTLAQAGHNALKAHCDALGIPVPFAYLSEAASMGCEHDGYVYLVRDWLIPIYVKHV